MIKVLSFRLQQCFRRFTILPFKGSSERRFFRYLSSHVFRVRQFKNTSVMRVILVLKMLKIEWKFQKCSKKIQKNIFGSWYNYIWKCCNNFPLLRTEYLSWSVNGLRNSRKILHMTQRKFFQLNFLQVINKYGKDAVVQVSAVLQRVYHVPSRRVLWNRAF